MTSGAIRTDFILSAEIMVIALNEVADQSFWPRFIILVVVALVITAAVYGVVALIVKMDDIGLSLAQRTSRLAQRVGRGLVAAMPKLLSALSTVGTVAMLWVGGHILLLGTDTLGWHAPYGFVHHLEESCTTPVEGVGGVLAWLVNTAASAVIGLVVGAVVVAIMHVLPFGAAKRPLDTDGGPEQLRRLRARRSGSARRRRPPTPPIPVPASPRSILACTTVEPSVHNRICGPSWRVGASISWPSCSPSMHSTDTANSGAGVLYTNSIPSLVIWGWMTSSVAGVKSSTRNSSGTSTCLGVSPPRSTLSELAITSTPTPCR